MSQYKLLSQTCNTSGLKNVSQTQMEWQEDVKAFGTYHEPNGSSRGGRQFHYGGNGWQAYLKKNGGATLKNTTTTIILQEDDYVSFKQRADKWGEDNNILLDSSYYNSTQYPGTDRAHHLLGGKGRRKEYYVEEADGTLTTGLGITDYAIANNLDPSTVMKVARNKTNARWKDKEGNPFEITYVNNDAPLGPLKDETKAKLSEALLGYKNPNVKAVNVYCAVSGSMLLNEALPSTVATLLNKGVKTINRYAASDYTKKMTSNNPYWCHTDTTPLVIREAQGDQAFPPKLSSKAYGAKIVSMDATTGRKIDTHLGIRGAHEATGVDRRMIREVLEGTRGEHLGYTFAYVECPSRQFNDNQITTPII